MSRPGVVAALAAAAALAGCGAQGSGTAEFEGEEERVAQAVEDLQTAAQDGEPRRICRALLDRELVRRLDRGDSDCVTRVDDALDEADNYELGVQDIRIEGDRAFARVEAGAENETERLELVRDGESWRIASLGDAG